MASLKDAEQARTEASDLLRDLGAHAISVEPDIGDEPLQPVEPTTSSERRPRSKYAVVAWFDRDPPDSVPAQIHVSHKRGTSAVPVKIRRAEAFAPEQLPAAQAKAGPGDFKPE